MADHISYDQAKKNVYRGLILLGVVTLIEVFISLLGKGDVIGDVSHLGWLIGLVAIGLVGLSLYKAYFIIYEFMHMRYEVRGLALSVLLPTLLLVWAVIAFFQEGNSWKNRRQNNGTPKSEQTTTPEQESMNLPEDVYVPRHG
jgi:cytochrome c oxidase subunit IV